MAILLSSHNRGTIAAGFSVIVLVLIYLVWNHSDTTALRYSSAEPTKDYTPKHDILDDTLNATLGFQKIFVINLSARTDHRDATSLAAAYTGLQLEYVEGVTNVSSKAFPPGQEEVKLDAGAAGNWRSHLNVMRLMVEQNISSALILEDDADWDIRIKSQMRDFARASRLLVQPLNGTTHTFLDPTWPRPSSVQQGHSDFDINEVATGEPTTSPYGDLDRWDLFWIGHCGCRFPQNSDQNVPLGRAVIMDDETVPGHKNLDMEFGDHQLLDQYPERTRVVSRARVNTCTLGYGISQQGARRMLFELGYRKISGPTDMMFRSVCDGVDGRDLAICLTVQPQLFNHHRPVGFKKSDISKDEESTPYNSVAYSTNIKWATRVNFQKLVNGETDYISRSIAKKSPSESGK